MPLTGLAGQCCTEALPTKQLNRPKVHHSCLRPVENGSLVSNICGYLETYFREVSAIYRRQEALQLLLEGHALKMIRKADTWKLQIDGSMPLKSQDIVGQRYAEYENIQENISKPKLQVALWLLLSIPVSVMIQLPNPKDSNLSTKQMKYIYVGHLTSGYLHPFCSSKSWLPANV